MLEIANSYRREKRVLCLNRFSVTVFDKDGRLAERLDARVTEFRVDIPIPMEVFAIGRYVTSNGKRFAYRSAKTVDANTRQRRESGRLLTLARVKDGSTIAQADSKELVGDANWWLDTYLVDDGSSFITLAGQKPVRVVRIELLPTPHVAASQELKNSSHDMYATDQPGLVVITCSHTRRGPRWFRVFDQQLRWLYKQQVPQLWAVSSVANRQAPLVLLTSPFHSRWQLVGRVKDKYTLLTSGNHLTQGRSRGIGAAAISPDGKWLVTSPRGSRPTLGIWSAADGTLLREVHLEGGFHRLPGEQVVIRLAFSESGRFLTAADGGNVYLLEFNEIVQPTYSRAATYEHGRDPGF